MHALTALSGLSAVAGGRVLIPMDTVFNYDGGTGIVTAAKLNSSTHGEALGTWTTPEGDPAHTSFEDHDVLLPVPFLCNDIEYDGSTATGITFDEALAPVGADVLHYALSVTEDDIQLAFLVKYATILDGGSPVSFNCDLWQIAGGNYTVPQRQHTFADARFFTAHSDGDLGASIPDNGEYLFITVFHDATNLRGRMLVQEVVLSGSDWIFGDILGSSTSLHLDPTAPIAYLRNQDYLRPASGTGNIKLKIAGIRRSVLTWPMYNPGAIATPSALSLTQTGPGELTFSWVSVFDIFAIERSADGEAFEVVEEEYENNGTDDYVDTDLEEGVSYAYRIRVVLGTRRSAAATSDAVTVDNAFTPPATCVHWLKPDSLALANNDPVATWSDSSGAGFHVTQATGANRPTYKTALLNGLPGVRGDGGDSLANASHVTSSEQHTIIGVAKVSSSNSSILYYVGNTAANGWGLFQDGSGNFCHFFGGAVSKVGAPLSATDYVIFSVLWDGSSSHLYINGVEDETLTDPSTPPVAPSGTTQVLGNPSANQWTGDLIEVLTFSSALSAGNRTMVQDYLGFKYGITVP